METAIRLRKHLSSFKFLPLLLILVTLASCSTKKSKILVITDVENLENIDESFTLVEKNTNLAYKEFYYEGENLEDTIFTIKVKDKLFKYPVPIQGLSVINLTTDELIAERAKYHSKYSVPISRAQQEIIDKFMDSVSKQAPDHVIKQAKEPDDMVILAPNSINIISYNPDNIVFGVNKTLPKEIMVKTNKNMPYYYKIYTKDQLKAQMQEEFENPRRIFIAK